KRSACVTNRRDRKVKRSTSIRWPGPNESTIPARLTSLRRFSTVVGWSASQLARKRPNVRMSRRCGGRCVRRQRICSGFDAANPMVVRVGDVEDALAIDNAAMRPVETSLASVATITSAAFASARYGCHLPRLPVDTPDRMILCIDNVNIARIIATESLGAVERRLVSRTVGRAACSRAGQRGDDAVGIDLAHGVALALGDVRVALAIHAHRPRSHENGLAGRTAVTDGPAIDLTLVSRGAGERRNSAGEQIDAANPAIAHIGDEQSAFAVQTAIVRLAQRRLGRLAAIVGM